MNESIRFGISNIAWPQENEYEAINYSANLGFQGLEIAPVKVFGPLKDVKLDELKKFKKYIDNLSMSIISLQGILYQVENVSLFESIETRANLKESLIQVANIASELGAKACVFGCPTLRDPGKLSLDDSFEIACEFFSSIADIFNKLGTNLCFEANPKVYGCKFCTKTSEALKLVKEVNSSGFRIQIDTSTIFINDEDFKILEDAFDFIGHFHVSEPNLTPIGSSYCDHSGVANVLHKNNFKKWISAEMRSDSKWKANLHAAYELFAKVYSNPNLFIL